MCDVEKMHLRVCCKTPNEPIVVYVQISSETIGLCAKCWGRIADKDWECDEEKVSMKEVDFQEGWIKPATEPTIDTQKTKSSNQEQELKAKKSKRAQSFKIEYNKDGSVKEETRLS